MRLAAISLLFLFHLPVTKAAGPSVTRLRSQDLEPARATAAIQAAIRSGADRVVIPYFGKPWIVDPIQLESNQEILFERGVELVARKGGFHGLNDSLLSAVGKKNIVLRGYGASLIMNKEDYRGPGYSRSEWRHCINLQSSRNIQILGLKLTSSGGDGIYIGRKQGLLPYSENIVVRDLVAEGHLRQGMSVISVDGLTVTQSVFKGSRGTAPEAGVDFEPNQPDERLSGISLRNCRFEENRSYGLLFALSRFNQDSSPISIAIQDSQASGNGKGVLEVLPGKSRGTVAFLGCELRGERRAPVSGDLNLVFTP